jgi:DNA-binding NarL/FixJ family response regulator
MSHSVVLIEDEPPARAKLARFLAEREDSRLVAEADTVESGIEAIRSTTPDVIYLDIQLGTQSGFDVLDSVRGVASPLIVFTTAFPQRGTTSKSMRPARFTSCENPSRISSRSSTHRNSCVCIGRTW